jgi:hypothetical protein
MAIPERLEILANDGLQHGAHTRDASELSESGRKSAEMMQSVDCDDRIHRARAQRNRRCVGENPMRRGLVGANFNHRRRAIKCYHRQAPPGQRVGVIAGTSADFEDGLSAQRPQSCDQRVGDPRLDASRFVIAGGNLAVVDGGRYWHDDDSTDVLRQTMRPRQI